MTEEGVGLLEDTTKPAAMATNALDIRHAYGLDQDSDDMSVSPNAISPEPRLDGSAELETRQAMETVPEEAAAANAMSQEAPTSIPIITTEEPMPDAEGADDSALSSVEAQEILPSSEQVPADEWTKSGGEADLESDVGAASADDVTGTTPDVVPASQEVSVVSEEACQDASPVDLLGDLAPQQEHMNPFDMMHGDLTSPAGADPCNPFTADDSSFLMQSPSDIPTESSNGTNPFAEPFKPRNEHTEEKHEPLESNGFDPLQSWGQPMGLPAPDRTSIAPKKSSTRKSSGDPKTTADKKATTDAAAATKSKSSTSKPNATAPAPSKSRVSSAGEDAKKATASKPSASMPKMHKLSGAKKEEDKNGSAKDAAAARRRSNIMPKTTRPASAPALPKLDSSIHQKAAPKPATTTRRPVSSVATAASRTPATRSTKTGPPVVPVYVDLTYIPCHGDTQYADVDFFRKVRARNYVLSSLNPSVAILDALLEAKQTWSNGDTEPSEVTLIPTYENDTVRHWMALHHDELAQHKITVAPSASRCTIQLQDHEASCSAYRIEF